MNETENADETLNKQIHKLANQMAIRRRQMRPSNRHIASMTACYRPKWRKSHNSSNKGVLFADMTDLDLRKIANKFAH